MSDSNVGVIPGLRAKPWRRSPSPKKILAIRYQALGDIIITLPYLQRLKALHPDAKLDLITRREFCDIPKNITLFDSVITINGGRNAKMQFLLTLLKMPFLWLQNYDVVLDLQNNRISVILRKLLAAEAWTEYDRVSPISAAERYRQTINRVGIGYVNLQTNFKINCDIDALLLNNHWKPDHDLVVLNPAGFCSSRNWPVDSYISFAKAWLRNVNSSTQFILLLLPSLQEKADAIANGIGENCINLTGKANQLQAFAILQKCKFVLSEDSGLMHMAWIQGVPTLALFSSSRKDWSAPQGEWSDCLDSSDLDCGPCMQEVCKYGDNRCLTRYTPDVVLQRATKILNHRRNIQ